ncbi:hypothetical protein AB0E69_30305 [Kribbella sp. NPDC026611]|uniref:hypothetical protein n=1 Tax=Kribbella sp. NPDC026611 TaxID=3154911 RepID=UPI0033C0602A
MTALQQQTADVEVFVDLVLGDDELMRAEFDDLIADCWESPREPPSDRLCPPDGGWAAPRPARWPAQPVIRPGRVPHRRPRGRERGPPRPRQDLRSDSKERQQRR